MNNENICAVLVSHKMLLHLTGRAFKVSDGRTDRLTDRLKPLSESKCQRVTNYRSYCCDGVFFLRIYKLRGLK